MEIANFIMKKNEMLKTFWVAIPHKGMWQKVAALTSITFQILLALHLQKFLSKYIIRHSTNAFSKIFSFFWIPILAIFAVWLTQSFLSFGESPRGLIRIVKSVLLLNSTELAYFSNTRLFIWPPEIETQSCEIRETRRL